MGETKCQLIERLSCLNHQQLSTTTPVSVNFNDQAGHTINDVRLIPTDLIYTQQKWLGKKGSRGSFDKQSQNITRLA